MNRAVTTPAVEISAACAALRRRWPRRVSLPNVLTGRYRVAATLLADSPPCWCALRHRQEPTRVSLS